MQGLNAAMKDYLEALDLRLRQLKALDLRLRQLEALDLRLRQLEGRIQRVEHFTGISEFDADQQATNLHRRLDAIEDKVYDRGDD